MSMKRSWISAGRSSAKMQQPRQYETWKGDRGSHAIGQVIGIDTTNTEAVDDHSGSRESPVPFYDEMTEFGYRSCTAARYGNKY